MRMGRVVNYKYKSRDFRHVRGRRSYRNEEVVLIALHLARKHAEEGPHKVQELIEVGILPLLISCLHLRNQNIRSVAADFLACIANGPTQHTYAVVQAGALPHLMGALDTPPSGPTLLSVLGAFGHVGSCGSQLRDYTISLGILSRLYRFAQPDIHPHCVQTVAWVMYRLCRTTSPPVHPDLLEDMTLVLSTLLMYPDMDITNYTLWSLFFLARNGVEYIQAVIDAGVVPRVVTLLGHPEGEIKSIALRTLGSVITGSDEQTQVVLDCGALDYFPALFDDFREGITKYSIWFLSNVLAGNREQVQTVLDHGLLPKIVSCLGSEDFEVQREAVWATVNLTTNDSDEQKLLLIREGAMEPFCRLLRCKDTQIVTILLKGVSNVLLALLEKSDPTVCEQLQRFGGWEAIHELRSHEDPTVQNLAKDIVSKFGLPDRADGDTGDANLDDAGTAAGDVVNEAGDVAAADPEIKIDKEISVPPPNEVQETAA